MPLIELPRSSRLVLASASPRRRELLASAGLSFDVVPADVDETPRPDEVPADYVRRLSIDKATAVAARGRIVVAADTTVEIDGVILEKPIDVDDARRMLGALSGRTHRALTAVTVMNQDWSDTRLVSTAVTFVELHPAAVEWYLGTGEAFDKAGGYGIQGAAAGFVERIDGSVTNVVGLPLAETLELLRSATQS